MDAGERHLDASMSDECGLVGVCWVRRSILEATSVSKDVLIATEISQAYRGSPRSVYRWLRSNELPPPPEQVVNPVARPEMGVWPGFSRAG